MSGWHAYTLQWRIIRAMTSQALTNKLFVQPRLQRNVKGPHCCPFVRPIYRCPTDCLHKGSVMMKATPFYDVLMICIISEVGALPVRLIYALGYQFSWIMPSQLVSVYGTWLECVYPDFVKYVTLESRCGWIFKRVFILILAEVILTLTPSGRNSMGDILKVTFYNVFGGKIMLVLRLKYWQIFSWGPLWWDSSIVEPVHWLIINPSWSLMRDLYWLLHYADWYIL